MLRTKAKAPAYLPSRYLVAPGTDQAVALEFSVERRRADPELLGGAGLVAPVELQDRDNVLLFDFVERP